MARNTSARRKRTNFRKRSGSPYAGLFGNQCGCQNCRGSRGLM